METYFGGNLLKNIPIWHLQKMKHIFIILLEFFLNWKKKSEFLVKFHEKFLIFHMKLGIFQSKFDSRVFVG